MVGVQCVELGSVCRADEARLVMADVHDYLMPAEASAELRGPA